MTDFFCPLPWIHQFIQPDGIKVCCSSNTKFNCSVEEFKQSDYLNTIKNTIKLGQIPNDCRQCVNAEQQGYNSTRLNALKDWEYDLTTVPSQLLYLDIRWSNLCNFSCRSCEPAFSSEIAREQEKYPVHRFNDRAVSGIFDTLDDILRINFTGGEPVLIKENILILEKLLDMGKNDCEILITTNGSIINYKIIELIKQFKNVHWTISLDAVDSAAEYIRNGTVWTKLKNNIDIILSFKHSVAFNCVVSAYSVLVLSNLVRYFLDLKNQHTDQPLELWFTICNYPKVLQPNALPDHLKPRAHIELNSSIEILTQITDNPIRAISDLFSLRNNIDGSDVKKQNQFVAFTEQLDLKRKQNFENVFNETLRG